LNHWQQLRHPSSFTKSIQAKRRSTAMSMPDPQQADNRPSKRGRLLAPSPNVDVLVPDLSYKRTRGRRAALNNFIEMPLDILFEVCLKSEVVTMQII
jgi:hypothetical protein